MALNNGLTVSKLNSRLAPGRYHDGRGTGLNVLVKKSGAKVLGAAIHGAR